MDSTTTTRTLDVRPWKVRAGDAMRVPVFPFEDATGRGWRTFRVAFVARERAYFSGESCWTIYADGEDEHGHYAARRLGTYYRDQRVTVTR